MGSAESRWLWDDDGEVQTEGEPVDNGRNHVVCRMFSVNAENGVEEKKWAG